MISKGLAYLLACIEFYLKMVLNQQETQRRLNPPMMDVVKKEILKLLEVGVIYPISDRKWTSPIQVAPKKSGVTIVKNDNNELVPTKVQTDWRVCIDYRKLNSCTRKDHFPLPFIAKCWRLLLYSVEHIGSYNNR